MSRESVKHSGLARLIENSRAGETFLVPAQLCSPVMRNNHNDGSILRVLFGILWLSSEFLRSGASVRLRASLTEIRIASGYENYGRDLPVLKGLSSLVDEVCDLQDGGQIRIFEKLEVVSFESRVVEWVFTQEFQELFVSPRVFAIASISEVIHLKSGLDFFLYLQVRRIWKMQRKSVDLTLQDIAKASGFDESVPIMRVSERAKRTIQRLENILHSEIQLHPIKLPGEKKYREVRLKVRATT